MRSPKQEPGRPETVEALVIASLSFREYVVRLLDRLLITIGHQEYSYLIAWKTEPHANDTDIWKIPAEIAIESNYFVFKLSIYPKMFDDWKAGSLRAVGCQLLHEVCHLITDPMYQLAQQDIKPSIHQTITDCNERQTQRTANAIQGLLDRHEPNWFRSL